jgi:hypothetical protein
LPPALAANIQQAIPTDLLRRAPHPLYSLAQNWIGPVSVGFATDWMHLTKTKPKNKVYKIRNPKKTADKFVIYVD